MAIVRPLLQTLSNKIMSKSFELLVWLFHLIVLSIENNWLLDLINVSWVELVIADREFFYAEIGFKGISNFITTFFSNATMEDFQLYNRLIIVNKMCNGSWPNITYITVSYDKLSKRFIQFKKLA